MQGRLEKKLARWEEAGLIEAAQRERILAWERARVRSRSESWTQVGVIALGAGISGLGVISLVAANWERIPDLAKVAGCLLLTAAIGAAAWEANRRGAGRWRDGALVLFQLAVAADIGVLGQVYHLRGTLQDAFTLWAVLVAPATHLLGGTVPRALLVLVGLPAVSLSIVDHQLAPRLDPRGLGALTLLVLLGVAVRFVSEARPTLGAYRWAGTFWMTAAGALAVWWGADGLRLRADGGEAAGWLAATWPLWVAWLLAAVAVAAARAWPARARIAVLAALVVFAAELAFGGAWREAATAIKGSEGVFLVRKFAPALVSVAVFGLYAAGAAFAGRRADFGFALALVALRFVGIYVDATGNLALAGILMVASGAVVLALARYVRRRAAPQGGAGGRT